LRAARTLTLWIAGNRRRYDWLKNGDIPTSPTS
jgi:hypothetical protein